jgi:hypothetical protein
MRKALVLAFLFMALQSGAQSKVSAVTPQPSILAAVPQKLILPL